MSKEMSKLDDEVGYLPAPVFEAFQRAREQVGSKLSDPELLLWARRGVAIAALPVRSWDAASEYFLATSAVCEYLSPAHLMECRSRSRVLREKPYPMWFRRRPCRGGDDECLVEKGYWTRRHDEHGS